MKMSKSGSIWLFIVAVFVSLVFVNLISVGSFIRFDLTKDGRYTLSAGSKETAASLSDAMVVTAYFTEGLPAPYASYSRYVRDMLEEYRAASDNKLAFEFIDPLAEETSEDKAKKKDTQQDIFGRVIREPTSVETELMRLGIQPVEIRVIEDDQQQTKRAYMGMVIRYQGKTEVFPVVQDFANFEKDLTVKMRKLTREKAPVVGILADDQNKLKNLKSLMGQTVTIKEISQKDLKEIPSDVDALLVVGIAKGLDKDALFAIDSFVTSGKNAAFFLDQYEIDLQTFQPKPADGTTEKSEIVSLLKSYGVELAPEMVADIQCASLTVQEQRGGMVFGVPTRYPFMPQVASLDQESPVTYGLSSAVFPFASPVIVDPKLDVKVRVLAQSSEKSWLEAWPVNTDPMREWKKEDVRSTGPHKLVVELRGKLRSYFNSEKNINDKKESRLLISGTSAFAWDQFLSEENQALSVASVDFLVSDDVVLSMRSRNFVDLPIDPNLTDDKRTTLKLANIIGVPALLVVYGLFRWRRRERRRKQISIESI